MKAINTAAGLYSGKLNGMVYYVRNGKTYVRRAPSPEKKAAPSEKQQGLNTRFRAVQWMYRTFREMVSPDIWRAAGKEQGKMAHNLFHSLNCGCFDEGGRLIDPENFHFSGGSLLLPREITVEREGPGVFRARWEEEREMTTAATTDRLQVGVLPGDRPEAVQAVTTVSGQRGDKEGTFILAPDITGTAHVYLYFAREDGTAFSPSRYFRVETGL